MPKKQRRRYKFRKGVTLGAVQAELDSTFLDGAFVDTGYLDILRDTDDRRSVIVGRTGSGKTALLLKVKGGRHRVIEIEPERLSLHYISNSTLIPKLNEIGIHFNLFYRWLWRHVIVVELINRWGRHEREDVRRSLVDRIRGMLPKKKNHKAKQLIDYGEEWGEKYFLTHEVRIKEIEERLSKQLKAELGGQFDVITGQLSGERTSDRTVLKEVVHKTQQIVNGVQVQQLDAIMQLVDEEILSDDQKPYYVVIDDLDRDWVEKEYAYDLIEALLEEVRHFAQFSNIKVIVALRTNIIDKLNERFSDKRGRQREKLEDLFLRLMWSREQLTKMMDLRVKLVLREQYGDAVTLDGVLPRPKGRKQRGQTGADYILDRIFDLPRDLITFMNCCLEKLERGEIRWSSVVASEAEYSDRRLDAIIDEWGENYPGLRDFLDLARGLPQTFRVSEFPQNDVYAYVAEHETDEPGTLGRMLYKTMFEEENELTDVCSDLIIPLLFQLGIIGIKQTVEEAVRYSYEYPRPPTLQIKPDMQIRVHPALHRALHIVSPEHS